MSIKVFIKGYTGISHLVTSEKKNKEGETGELKGPSKKGESPKKKRERL